MDQDYKNFEIIVVDDGSRDNTYHVAKNILEKGNLHRWRIITKSNGGAGSARNTGLKEAVGDYIVFLDSDDYISPKLLKKLREVIMIEIPDMICWKFQCVSEFGKLTHFQFPFEGLVEGQIYTGLDVLERILIERDFYIWMGSAAYSRKLIFENNLLFDERFWVGEDSNFINKCLINAQKVIFINDVLSYYVQRKGSLTKTAVLNGKQSDGYLALMDTYNYVIQRFKDFERYEKIAITLKEEAIYTFLICLKFYISLLKKPLYKKIVQTIHSRHPNLLQNVLSASRTIHKTLSKRRLKEKMSLKIFNLSPRLFTIFTWLYHIVKSKIQNINRDLWLDTDSR